MEYVVREFVDGRDRTKYSGVAAGHPGRQTRRRHQRHALRRLSRHVRCWQARPGPVPTRSLSHLQKRRERAQASQPADLPVQPGPLIRLLQRLPRQLRAGQLQKGEQSWLSMSRTPEETGCSGDKTHWRLNPRCLASRAFLPGQPAGACGHRPGWPGSPQVFAWETCGLSKRAESQRIG